MQKKSTRRSFRFEHLELRRVMALTTPDLVELASNDATYSGASPVLQRTLVAPTVASDLQGQPAYDLRTDLPGDQTLRLAADSSNMDGASDSRFGRPFARILVNPFSVYEVNQYTGFKSWQVTVDAYDQSGAFIKTLSLGVVDDPKRDLEGDWHRGFIGNPNDRGSNFVELPAQTSVIELRTNSAITIGFLGDVYDSGPQAVRWNDQPSHVSRRPVDLVESDQAIFVEDGKSYALAARVNYRGSTTSIAHSVGYTAYDRDGLQIEPKHVERFGTATDTILAADLNPGDTTIELVNASGWSNESSRPETRSIAWYRYADSTGKVYADYTYTRNVASNLGYGMWSAGGINGNRITLRQPWSGPRLDAGSAVRNTVAGPALYSVVASRQTAPINAAASVSGFWKNGFADPKAFPVGTSTFRPAAVLNQTLQLVGMAELSFTVSTQAVTAATIDTTRNTRSVVIDVLANDAVAESADGRLVSVSAPKYGTVQIVPATPTTRQLLRYTTAANFIGTDRFSYTYSNASGESFTEWVNVASLGGNLNANPALQQSIANSQSSLTAESSVTDHGGVVFSALSGQEVSSAANNLNNLSFLQRSTVVPVSYVLTRGTLHGTLKINADGTLTYQSVPGFVGTDTFEYLASNGLQSSPRIGLIRVAASNDELDRVKLAEIGLGLHNLESAFKQTFYPPAAPKDANGVPLVSWRVYVLPYVGYSWLFDRFKLNEAWNSPNNLPLLDLMPDIFRSSGDPTGSNLTRFQTIQASQANSPTEHFLNSNGSPRNVKFNQITHGLSNVLMALRAGSDRAVPWTKPEDLRFDNANPLGTLGSLSEPFLPVVFGEAIAVMMPSNIASSVFTSLATVASTPGVVAANGSTLTRAWSEQLTPPAEHLQNNYVKQRNWMKAIGLAMHNYEATYKLLPPAASVDASGNQLLSWRVHLLPFLEQYELYDRFHLNEPWNSPHNLTLLNSMPDFFRSAGDSSTTNTTRLRLLNGPGTLYSSGRTGALRFASIADGLSNTIFAIEAGTDKAVPWTAPDTLPITSDFLASVGQLPDKVIRMIIADGSLLSVPVTESNATLYAMATHASGDLFQHPGNSSLEYYIPHVPNSIKQIMLGIHNFESAFKRLPKNYWGRQEIKLTSLPTLSWRVAILPFIEQGPLYEAFHLDEAWDSPHNLSLLKYMPAIFRSMGDAPGSTTTRLQMFSGAKTVLHPDFRHVKFGDITDGTSNTLGVVEAGVDKAVPWTKPSDLDGDTLELWQALGLVGQSVVVGMMDGSVRDVAKRDMPYLTELVQRNDGGAVDALVSTQLIAIREGEVATIDVPGNSFVLDPQSFVELASTSAYYNGLSVTRVALRAIPNSTLDGPRVTRLLVNGRAIEIVVLDGDALGLSVDSEVVNEAGGQATFTVTRPSTDNSSPLTVRLTSSKPARLPVPESVVIPAGQSSITFTATAVDNSSIGDAEQVRVTAVAAGLSDSSVLVLLADDESLILTFSPPSIPESAGVTTGTLKRVGNPALPLVVRLTNLMPSKISVPEQVIIPAGQISVDFPITAIDNAIYDGTSDIGILAQGTDYAMGRGALKVTDFEAIELGLSKERASEAGETLSLTVRRTADSQGQPVILRLRTDRPDKLQLPESVIIPADLDEIIVELRTLDNRLLDGLTRVNINAISDSFGDEYVAGEATLDVADHEALSLTLTPMQVSEKNGTGLGRLTRSNTDINRAVTVGLITNHPELVTIPTSVTIPAGFEFVEFAISAIDNSDLNSVPQVTIDAIHAAYLPESLTFDVLDYEPLSLTLTKPSGVEGSTLTATVSRAVNNLDQAAVVLLSSSNSSQVGLPVSVTIPANERSISFSVSLLRDQILDGTQTIPIQAESVGYVSATTAVVVEDRETIQVALTGSARIYESDGIVMATLSRSDIGSDFPLTILATSSDPSVASVGTAPLRIEAHQNSITFPITIPNDQVFESTQSVRLNFAVQDRAFEEFGLDLEVIDDESPWHNKINPLDVNRDQVITPLDALLVINYLNSLGSRATSDLPTPGDGQPVFVDTNSDQNLSAIDALLIINELNNPSTALNAEGEPTWSAAAEPPLLRPVVRFSKRPVFSRGR